MKSGILATTTLLVILGTVEQVQSQTEADRDRREFDATKFSDRSDSAAAETIFAETNNEVNLGWQTDFGTQLSTSAPVSKAFIPLPADLSTENPEWSHQLHANLPPRNPTPSPRADREIEGTSTESLRESENPSRGTSINFYHNNRHGSAGYDHTKFGDNPSVSKPEALQQVEALSTQSVRQAEIPPLAAVTNYLPETLERRSKTPVFTDFGWPARATMTSGYGWRWGRMHNGVDLAGPVGTPIVAAGDGVVITSEWNTGGYGNLVEIEHSDGTITLYAHNHENRVRVGEFVQKGQLIALMGSTGYSTGPHLHFEIHVPGQGAVNPIAYMPSSHSVTQQSRSRYR